MERGVRAAQQSPCDQMGDSAASGDRGEIPGGECVGSDGWNYKVEDLAHAVATSVPGTKVSINTAARPDGRSYQVDLALFRKLAPNHQPQETLKSSIEALRDGLREIAFADRDFRQSQLIRLKTLERHMEQKRLDKDLRWLQ